MDFFKTKKWIFTKLVNKVFFFFTWSLQSHVPVYWWCIWHRFTGFSAVVCRLWKQSRYSLKVYVYILIISVMRRLHKGSPFLDSQEGPQNSRGKKENPGANEWRGAWERGRKAFPVTSPPVSPPFFSLLQSRHAINSSCSWLSLCLLDYPEKGLLAVYSYALHVPSTLRLFLQIFPFFFHPLNLPLFPCSLCVFSFLIHFFSSILASALCIVLLGYLVEMFVLPFWVFQSHINFRICCCHSTFSSDAWSFGFQWASAVLPESQRSAKVFCMASRSGTQEILILLVMIQFSTILFN